MEIGERIRKSRLDKGFTQSQLAVKIGVQTSAVSKYEKGLVSPTFEQLQKISDALDVPIGILLGHEVKDIFTGKSTLQIQVLKAMEEFEKLEDLVLSGKATKREKIRYADLNAEMATCLNLLTRMNRRETKKADETD